MTARVITKDGRTWMVWTRPAKRPAPIRPTLTVLRGRQYVTRIPRKTAADSGRAA